VFGITTSGFYNFKTTGTIMDFKELKKQLKDITKIGNCNQDVQGWATDMGLWIKLQNVQDPRTIFYGCLLTSQGDAQRFLEDLQELQEEEESDSDIDSEDNDDSSEEADIEDKEKVQPYPSFEKIVSSLKIFYGISEDQNSLLREIRSLRIDKNEKVKDFNIRYRSLYTKLDKKRRKTIGILEYTDSLRPNYEAWKRVSLKGDVITLEKAYLLAEKVDRLSSQKPDDSRKNNQSNFSRQSFAKTNSKSTLSEENHSKKVKQMICFYCREQGHFQSECPKLKKIIEDNKRSIFNSNSLN